MLYCMRFQLESQSFSVQLEVKVESQCWSRNSLGLKLMARCSPRGKPSGQVLGLSLAALRAVRSGVASIRDL
jgi:hypothetical protein